MKLCKDCKHLVSGILCACPSNPVNPVDGKPKDYFARLCRNEVGLFGNGCGPSARYFEAKVPTKPWWNFWRAE